MILILFGTRPEAVKLGAVAAELRAISAPVRCLCTGQHTDLLAGTPAESDLTGTSLALRGSGNAGEWVIENLGTLVEAIRHRPPTLIVVQGDTVSAYAGALAGRILGIPVAHIEAGVRSGDFRNPYPEEHLRVQISKLASYHLCATDGNLQNLINEGIPGTSGGPDEEWDGQYTAWVTGNPGISALYRYAKVKPIEVPEPTIFVTMHRREFLAGGSGHVLPTLNAFVDAAKRHPNILFAWPVHPAMRGMYPDPFWRVAPDNVHGIQPLPYVVMARQVARAQGIITDSGGLQEEAGTLGVPCAVMRYATDRPESVEAGMAKLFDPTPAGMTAAVEWLTGPNCPPRRPLSVFGDRDSAKRIAAMLSELA